uniref:E3 ubiquitin-protein ligase RBBP6 n=1 Tax=Caenorhabditis tropicalis TaxID=1561998 RepID=A0A1I7T1A2_9PELO
MSSIHYKFRAELDYKTLQFDGLHIRGEQLVREICTKENLKLELFELQLQNAHTKKMYSDDELIPRNSSIIVQRFPRKDAAKVQKVQAGVNSGMINQADATSSTIDPSTHIASADFENMDESERLNHIRDQSTRAYDPSNFRRRPQGIMTGPPPPTYTCNRCYQPGHWYKNCPMLNTKRTTGIPSQELMETTADDPSAMLHPSGKYVVPIMHWKARQDTLTKKSEDGSSSPAQVDRKVPPELLCPLCQSIFNQAIVTSCCGNSYCAECIEQRILDPDNAKCPGDDCGRDISITSIIPNKTLRDAAAAWISANAPGAAPVNQVGQEPEQIRIRIGLKAPSSSTSLASQNVSGISPGSALALQQPISVPVTTSSIVSVASNTAAPQAMTTLNPAIPGLPHAPTSVNSAAVIQDVSLPPPQLRHELPPGIPGVSSLNQFPQSTLNVPGLPGQVIAHPQTVPLSYSIPVFTPGFPPAASSAPRASVMSGIDEWNAFLQNKDKRRDQRDKDRTRRKERHDSRNHRRRDSSSSTSSTLSSFSGDEDRYRRKRREKESKKRRSVEKERQRRSDDHRRIRDRERERDRDRDHRESRSSARSKDVKTTSSSSHRRDRDEPKRRERKREDERRKIETMNIKRMMIQLKTAMILSQRTKTKLMESSLNMAMYKRPK